MREYTISRKPDVLDWDQITALKIDCLLWSPEVPITAQAKLCYDDTAIYVQLSSSEPHIRAENSGKLGYPHEDSCLEFFIAPVHGDQRYINIEMNPNGCMYMGLGGPFGLIRLLPPDSALSPVIHRSAEHWDITYALPCSLIRQFFPEFQPESGGTIRANCYKCGDLTVQEHYLAWNPIPLPAPKFHCPEYFGMMRFE